MSPPQVILSPERQLSLSRFSSYIDNSTTARFARTSNYSIIQPEEQPHAGCFLFMPTSAEILGQLQSFQSARRKPQDVLAEQENKLGVSGVRQRQAGLRGAIQNTENLLKQVDPSVTGRTSGSLVSEAQRTKMVANERAPIADQFSEQSRALEGETANLSDLSSSARTAAQLAISADDQQQNYLQSLYQTTYQRERDEQERQERERQRQEEQRRAAAQEAAQRSYLASLVPRPAPSATTAARPDLGSIFSRTGLPVIQANPRSSIMLQPSAPRNNLQGNRISLQGGVRSLQGSGIRLQ